MSENMPHTGTGVERLRLWRERFRETLAPSPLEDAEQLAARLDLTHAHPSGIAKLFASGQVSLDSLFRDNGMLRAAGRRIERVLDDRAAKSRVSGMAELSLVVGIATWSGRQMPVLLYPVDVERRGDSVTTGTTIRFTGRVHLNSAFVNEMRNGGVELDERDLFDGSHYATGSPETSTVFSAITNLATQVFGDFAIERHIVIGCFFDPSTQMLLESQRIIDALAQGPTGNTLLDALAGYGSAADALRNDAIAEFSPFDGDPHSEFEAGDVDNTTRYAASVAAAGHSAVLDCAAGVNTAEQAVALASRCVMSGRSVLYVPCVSDQKRRFMQAMRANELGGLVLDLADPDTNGAIDKQLITAVGFQSGVATSRFDQLSDELVGVRSRLTRYLGDLHGVNQDWDVSAYQTIQHLANIAELPTHPATRVRLSKESARALKGRLDEWSDRLRRAGELGEFVIGPADTVWYKASLFTEEEAVAAYQRVSDVLLKMLPATREQVTSVVQTCGFPVPNTANDWARQVTVLKNLRRVLDVFQPEIFERDINAMIEASKSKAARKAEGTTLGFWERHRLLKEAKSLLRVGAQVENLHDALQVVARQAEQWRVFVPHGGWPVLPPHLDDIIDTQEQLAADLTALDTVLATTPSGGDLQSLDLNQVETRLKALYDDRLALDTLPERCRLERDFQTVGLGELVGDLNARRVDVDAVDGELQLAWWTTVFEDIVRSSAIISNQDGLAMQAAADRFVQVDIEHVRSAGPMVAQETTRRLCDMLFARTQEANLLHTTLAGSHKVPLSRIRRDHAEIFAAAKPVLVATPAALSATTDPEPVADVAVIDAGAHMQPLELLTIASRARQVVVLAHCDTTSCEGLKMLADMLPRITMKPSSSRRSPRLTAFLEAEGYGALSYDVAKAGGQGHVLFHRIEANGVPVMTSGLVESSQQEIDEVVRLITERAAEFTIVPAGYTLTVVVLTGVFRLRLGAELKSLAARNKSMDRFLRHVRLVDIDEVTGAYATDVILSLSYAKTAHGRLLQQFGDAGSAGGRGMLLDALALTSRHLDIVAAFGSEDMEDERLHQPGAKLLKSILQWAEQLDDQPVLPQSLDAGSNVLFNDLAERIRKRGLEVAVDYGFEKGLRIPMVVGLKNRPFALAVMTDDTGFMGIQSTRERHRVLMQRMQTLGWSVMTVWSVGAFVNPEKEVDRIIARLGELYRDVQ